MSGKIARRPRIEESRRLRAELGEQVSELCPLDGVEKRIVHPAGA
jgi:hypothetical protein